MQPGPSLDEKIPVFVFPNSLDFYSTDKTHKKLLTVYNPYEFGVRFKVLCTAPEKYEVSSPDGKIKPRCQIDLVVRHKAPTPANSNISDKIRVQMLNRETKQVIGKKDILLTLHSGEPPREDDDHSSEFSADRTSEWKRSSLAHFDSYPQDRKGAIKTSPHPLIWLTGIICFVCLLFPNEGETSSLSFSVPFNVKLIFSYILAANSLYFFILPGDDRQLKVLEQTKQHLRIKSTAWLQWLCSEHESRICKAWPPSCVQQIERLATTDTVQC